MNTKWAIWITMLTIAGPHTALAGDHVWTSLGPYGGIAGALATDPSNSDIAYAGTSGGVFKTVDGGSNWSLATYGLPPGFVAGSLAIDPKQPGIVYAGGSCPTPATCGVYKSTDGGANWRAATSGLDDVAAVVSLVIDPGNSATLYAGLQLYANGFGPGFPFPPDLTPAVFRSTDGGASWSALASGSPGMWMPEVPLALDPWNSGTLYAALGTCIYTFCSGGVVKSIDGGVSWHPANTGLPACCINALVTDLRNPNTIYAVGPQVFKTTNGGASWSAMSTGLPSFCCMFLAIDPQNSNILYTATYGNTSNGLYYQPFRSSDGGRSWTSMQPWSNPVPLLYNLPPVNFYAGIATDRNGGLYLATPGLGLFKSTDRAQSWTAINSGLSATKVDSLAIDPRDPNTIYAATRAEALGGVFKTTDRGANWSAADDGLPAASSASDVNPPPMSLVIDPQNSGTIYAGVHAGLFKSTDSGATWISLNDALAATASGPAGLDGPLAVDPNYPGTLFSGGTLAGATPAWGLFKGTNGGSRWTHTSFGNDATALAFDPQNPGTLYLGVGWRILKSVDGGAGWTELSMPPAFNPDDCEDFCTPAKVLAVDPVRPLTVYAGGTTGLWKSTDGGATWNQMTSAPFEPVALAIDPVYSDNLYAAAGNRVFRSTNGAAHWTDITSGLTVQSINNLLMTPQSPGTLYAATVGGGVVAITFPDEARRPHPGR